MAKDPAFLFYYQDFMVGTDDLSNEEVGAYIRCLCIQAAKGGISEQHMKNICKSHEVHKIIIKKFIFYPEEACFRNDRLSEEMEKRKKYSKSRSANRLGKNKQNDISFSYDSHMENENENENSKNNGAKTEVGKLSNNFAAQREQVLLNRVAAGVRSAESGGTENT
jgi:uncharacterized protein YdaU (DUF1376 family)